MRRLVWILALASLSASILVACADDDNTPLAGRDGGTFDSSSPVDGGNDTGAVSDAAQDSGSDASDGGDGGSNDADASSDADADG